MAKQKTNNGTPGPQTSAASLGFEAELFKAADKLRGNMEPSDYKHVALGLIFLKYICCSEFHTRKCSFGDSLSVDSTLSGEQLESWLSSPNRRGSVRSSKISFTFLNGVNRSTSGSDNHVSTFRAAFWSACNTTPSEQ